jgi:hypothetical protein
VFAVVVWRALLAKTYHVVTASMMIEPIHPVQCCGELTTPSLSMGVKGSLTRCRSTAVITMAVAATIARANHNVVLLLTILDP